MAVDREAMGRDSISGSDERSHYLDLSTGGELVDGSNHGSIGGTSVANDYRYSNNDVRYVH